MKNVRGQRLLNIASKLDALSEDDGEFTKLALSIVDENNDSSTVALCREISVLIEDPKSRFIVT